MRLGLCLALLSAMGCRFEIPAVPLEAGVGGPDLSIDLASHRDAALDFSPAGDLSLGIVPSHVDPTGLPLPAGALSGVTQIDTSNLTIQLAGNAVLPAGVALSREASHGWAVLTVGSWTVDQELFVVGTPALVVIAAGAVDVKQPIRTDARFDVPGPGGAPPRMGAGAGVDGPAGTNGNGDDAGGGGGSFGGTGGAGGSTTSVFAPLTGGAAGALYGDMLDFFGGGSGGGNGGHFASCSDQTRAIGGAGGGAIQISSAASITVEGGGSIGAGGGGGHGGCQDVASAAGGGGSGGEIFLEAPTITIQGTLSANGGGGGGGAQYLIANGGNGDNGSDKPAMGGKGSNPGTPGGGGDGGGGGFDGVTAGAGGNATNAGGGGGGVGRIVLRTRGAAATVMSGKVSPQPSLSTNL